MFREYKVDKAVVHKRFKIIYFSVIGLVALTLIAGLATTAFGMINNHEYNVISIFKLAFVAIVIFFASLTILGYYGGLKLQEKVIGNLILTSDGITLNAGLSS